MVVAVVDGGVEVTHPAVGRNMWANLGEVGAKGVDDDANGEGKGLRLGRGITGMHD